MKQSNNPVTTCQHMNFQAKVEVAHLEDSGQFIADVRVECAECKLPFQFLGLDCGLDTQGAKVSIDGLEARLAALRRKKKRMPIKNYTTPQWIIEAYQKLHREAVKRNPFYVG